MSRSPRDGLTISQQSDYLEATRALDRMWRAGFSWSGHEKDVALLNMGVKDGVVRYADISAVSGFHSIGDGRAVAITDWDSDGDMDAWVMSRTAPQIQFLENTTRTPGSVKPAFLMLRLQDDGQHGPRDATGARAELILEPKSPRLVRTVRTGDTHCSHSTHWLHFGLGEDAPKVLELTVRWSDGTVERFPKPAINQHYVLRRGRALQRFAPPKKSSPLQAAKIETPQPSRFSVYSNRVPSLPLEWQDDTKQTRSLSDYRGRPVVLLLWASWCGNCLEEMSTLSKRSELFKNANIALIAMNIDEASNESEGDLAHAQELWAGLNVPGELGIGSRDLMHRLEAFRAATHWIGGPLRIPSLFVFDAEGRLVGHAEGVLDDHDWNRVKDALAAKSDQWMELAMPFPGSRYGSLAPIRPADVPLHLMEDDEFALAQLYLKTHGNELEDAFRAGKEPGLPRVLYTLAVHLALEGRSAEAMDVYRRAIKLRPSYVDARYNLAGLLQASGESKAAIEQYSAILELAPSHAASWHNRALLRQEAGDLQLAADDYRMALRHAAGSLDTMNNLANTLFALQQTDEAFQTFEMAIDISPGYARTHYNYAVALEQAGQFGEAEKAYRTSVELEPANAQHAHNLGVLMAKQQRWPEAKQWLRQSLKLDPAHPTANRNLQKVLELEKRAGR